MYKIEGPEDGGKAPNGPNFLLIVILSLVAAAIIFVVALVVVGKIGGSMHILHPDKHPTSQLLVGSDGVRLA